MALTAKQFWKLMERLKVPDAAALELVGFARKMGNPGSVPGSGFFPSTRRRLASWPRSTRHYWQRGNRQSGFTETTGQRPLGAECRSN
jgi:hypothetical protein